MHTRFRITKEKHEQE